MVLNLSSCYLLIKEFHPLKIIGMQAARSDRISSSHVDANTYIDFDLYIVRFENQR